MLAGTGAVTSRTFFALSIDEFVSDELELVHQPTGDFKMKFLLCEVESFFDEEQDQSMCKVSKPLQVFETLKEAEEACELFNPFYNFELRVVNSDNIDEIFR